MKNHIRFYCDETDRPLEKIEDPEIKELIEKTATKIAVRIIKNCISIDESEFAYTDNALSYYRTLKDDLLLLKLAKEDNLELKPDSDLAKLKNRIGEEAIERGELMTMMFVEWEEKALVGKWRLNEDLNEKMNELAEKYDCIWCEEECFITGDCVIKMIAPLSASKWFTENAKSWVYACLNNNDYYVSDLFSVYCKNKKKPVTVTMQVIFNQTKLRYFNKSREEFMAPFYECCDNNGIFNPQDEIYIFTGENPLEVMRPLIKLMAESSDFMFVINDWYLYYEDVTINLLKKALLGELEN